MGGGGGRGPGGYEELWDYVNWRRLVTEILVKRVTKKNTNQGCINNHIWYIYKLKYIFRTLLSQGVQGNVSLDKPQWGYILLGKPLWEKNIEIRRCLLRCTFCTPLWNWKCPQYMKVRALSVWLWSVEILQTRLSQPSSNKNHVSHMLTNS